MRRSVIKEIGLLDEGYFMYAEEVDWCLRTEAGGLGDLAGAEGMCDTCGWCINQPVQSCDGLAALYRSMYGFLENFMPPHMHCCIVLL